MMCFAAIAVKTTRKFSNSFWMVTTNLATTYCFYLNLGDRGIDAPVESPSCEMSGEQDEAEDEDEIRNRRADEQSS